MEFSSSFQYFESSRFKTGAKSSPQLFSEFRSQFVYTRLGLGISKSLTVSVEAGYFPEKEMVGLYDSLKLEKPVISSSGLSDLIIFPKLNVLNHIGKSSNTEITVGLGYKFPMGAYADSHVVYTRPSDGKEFYTISAPLVQPSTGSKDAIAYLFLMKSFPKRNFRIFSNMVYIYKGWNSLGQKFGDFTSVSLFAGKTFFKKLAITIQVRGEQAGPLQGAKNINLLAFYNIDAASTGYRKIALAPQLTYSIKNISFFVIPEFPLYEFVNGTQLATQNLITAGFSYRFFPAAPPCAPGEPLYQCSMKCKGGGAEQPGDCSVCGMPLKKGRRK